MSGPSWREWAWRLNGPIRVPTRHATLLRHAHWYLECVRLVRGQRRDARFGVPCCPTVRQLGGYLSTHCSNGWGGRCEDALAVCVSHCPRRPDAHPVATHPPSRGARPPRRRSRAPAHARRARAARGCARCAICTGHKPPTPLRSRS
eukprot:6213736-Pleurochrysis_carterae.AAC.2